MLFVIFIKIIVIQSAVGWDYQEKLQKHESQTDYSKGFGGKFGVQTDRQDAAAVGFDDEQGHVGTNYEKASSLKSRFESLAAANNSPSEVKYFVICLLLVSSHI